MCTTNNKTMEDSRRIQLKRPNKLSISKNKKGADSPTTPCRAMCSPKIFDTPPSGRAHGGAHPSFSTPVNQRVRCNFFDESPSQDYDTDNICSQDDRENILDVGWKWEAHAPNIMKKIIKIEPKRLLPVRAVRCHRSPHALKTPESGEKKGFYKFKEELSKMLSTARDFSECETSDLDGDKDNIELLAFTQNEEDRVEPLSVFQMIESVESRKGAKLEINERLKDEISVHKAKKPVEFKVESCEQKCPATIGAETAESLHHATNPKLAFPSNTNLLDQSDLDNLLLQCSQKVEDNYRVATKKSKVETNNFFGNDSFDDLFLSVPIDDKAVQNGQLKHCRSPLVRHNSMPAKSPASKYVPVRITNGFIRHNSMPSNESQQVEGDNCSGCSKSSSTESVSSEKRRCTAEEIERKRQEALQRREASKLKKMSSCRTSTVTSTNSSKVKR